MRQRSGWKDLQWLNSVPVCISVVLKNFTLNVQAILVNLQTFAFRKRNEQLQMTQELCVQKKSIKSIPEVKFCYYVNQHSVTQVKASSPSLPSPQKNCSQGSFTLQKQARN